MTVEKIPLSRILENPWQTREASDPEHIQSLADSIRDNGLLQIPTGRRKDSGEVELAFGMTRFAAFRYLHNAEPNNDDYAEMPVDIKRISDKRMMEMAVVENAQRKDLSPIEQANTMRRLMAEHRYSRNEVASLFGMTPGAISNKIALLDLPASVQDYVSTGELPERTGRLMVQLARLDGPLSEKTAMLLAGSADLKPERASAIIAEAMRKAAVEICGPNEPDRIKGEYYSLSDQIGKTHVRTARIERALAYLTDNAGMIELMGEPESLRDYAGGLREGLDKGLSQEELQRLYGYLPEAVSRAAHLLAPPACTACEYHSVIAGAHFCAFEECLLTKIDAFMQDDIRRARAALDMPAIPVYQSRDGRYISYSGGNEWTAQETTETIKKMFQTALKTRSGDLRLRKCTPPIGSIEHPLTRAQLHELCAVGSLAEEAQAARAAAYETSKQRQQAGPSEEENDDNPESCREIMNRAVLLYEKMFEPFALKQLEMLARIIFFVELEEPLFEGQESMSKDQYERELRRYLAYGSVKSVTRLIASWSVEEHISRLEKFASEYGSSIPEGWHGTGQEAPQKAQEVVYEKGEEEIPF